MTQRQPRVVLHLNLHREHFLAILDGSKTTEYRERSGYWHGRLRGRKYTRICFRNGYLDQTPEMLVECVEVVTRPDYFAIRLGRVVRKRNTQALANRAGAKGA
jgi:hypothetical protein